MQKGSRERQGEEATSRSRVSSLLGSIEWIVGVLSLLAISVAIFVPLRPSFPAGTQLDNSWVTGLNEAMALGLSVGDDIVFTFGPYASVYTGEYHRATDTLMLFGGTVLAIGFASVLAAIALFRGVALSIVVALSLLILFRQKDALFFAYPLLFSVYVYQRYLCCSSSEKGLAPAYRVLLALLLVPFGLLPLIKGSALMIVGGTAVLCGAALSRQRRRFEGAACLAVPTLSCGAFWLLSGQSPLDLFRFLWNLAPIVTGFTPAMSSSGSSLEIYVYLIGAGAVLGRVFWQPEMRLPERLFLTLAFALFLFLAFKAGFVRHDGHAITAAAAIGIAAFVLVAAMSRPPMLPLVVCLAVWAYLDGAYTNTSTRSLVDRATHPFSSLRDGWSLRWNGGRDEFDKMSTGQKVVLVKECPIDSLDGTADIYSYRQACLIFSGNRWSPRPVFQSYSAYTPRLARMNAEHLVGSTAPKHVLFRIEPIDNRFPSLEDGLSWPLLLSAYEPSKLDGDLVYLIRRQAAPPLKLPEFEQAGGTVRAGETVEVSKHDAPLMAQLDVRPTLLGRIAGIVFKTPAPMLRVVLASGAERTYRFVPGMGAAGFLLSPHVAATRDFVLLLEGDSASLSGSKVVSFKIDLGRYGDWFWSDQLEVRYEKLRFDPARTQLSKRLFDRPLDAAPLAGKVDATMVCEGSVDRLNGVSPVPPAVTSGTVIGLDGWTAVSTKTGELPDRVLVVVKDASSKLLYFPARATSRPDVRDHFKQPGLLNSGFEAYVDLSAVQGDVVQFFIAHETRGRLVHCQPFRSIKVSR